MEFQGGEPLLRFDLVQEAVGTQKNRRPQRKHIDLVVCTTHAARRCPSRFLREHGVLISTSLDGPAFSTTATGLVGRLLRITLQSSETSVELKRRSGAKPFRRS